MKIQQFIEKAIEGGYREGRTNWQYFDITAEGAVHQEDERTVIPVEKILLDPEAWKAVGKVEGWCDSNVGVNGACVDCGFKTHGCQWLENWHSMIDALAEGGSIESYLETL
jgi:hypothetical protein